MEDSKFRKKLVVCLSSQEFAEALHKQEKKEKKDKPAR
jgi:hypothetical protein